MVIGEERIRYPRRVRRGSQEEENVHDQRAGVRPVDEMTCSEPHTPIESSGSLTPTTFRKRWTTGALVLDW